MRYRPRIATQKKIATVAAASSASVQSRSRFHRETLSPMSEARASTRDNVSRAAAPPLRSLARHRQAQAEQQRRGRRSLATRLPTLSGDARRTRAACRRQRQARGTKSSRWSRTSTRGRQNAATFVSLSGAMNCGISARKNKATFGSQHVRHDAVAKAQPQQRRLCRLEVVCGAVDVRSAQHPHAEINEVRRAEQFRDRERRRRRGQIAEQTKRRPSRLCTSEPTAIPSRGRDAAPRPSATLRPRM